MIENESQESWAKSYENHSKNFLKGKKCLWKKQECVLYKVGDFGSEIHFLDDNIYLTVDNKELTLIIDEKEEKFKCESIFCDFKSGTRKEIGKHYVEIHKTTLKDEAVKKKNRIKKIKKEQKETKKKIINDVIKIIKNGELIQSKYESEYDSLLENIRANINRIIITK